MDGTVAPVGMPVDLTVLHALKTVDQGQAGRDAADAVSDRPGFLRLRLFNCFFQDM
jgi:hypothetical protein